jgi:hypothetical protein
MGGPGDADRQGKQLIDEANRMVVGDLALARLFSDDGRAFWVEKLWPKHFIHTVS